MKVRWRIVLPGVLAGVGLVAVLYRTGVPDRSAQQAAQASREKLKHDGFRVALEEFDLLPPAASTDRAASFVVLCDALNRSPGVRSLASAQMEFIGPSAARVSWRDGAETGDSPDASNAALDAIRAHRPSVHALATAVLLGPIRFAVIQPPGILQYPHLDSLRTSASLLAAAMAADLRHHDQRSAWTNLLALTSLATGWMPEPAAASHITRFRLQATAFAATWEALQAPGWTDEQLAFLQDQWARLDLWSPLPDTAALARAEALRVCELSRAEPTLPLWDTLGEFWQACLQQWKSPSAILGWSRTRFRSWRSAVDYNRHLSYVDEVNLGEYYRAREEELRDAITRKSWIELRGLPIASQPPRLSPATAGLGQKASEPAPSRSEQADQAIPQALISRAAVAESLRRILITALAVERHHARHPGAYPEHLKVIPDELFPVPPVDFMDAQTLRYRREKEGFIVYSVGPDLVDDQGNGMRQYDPASVTLRQPDLVWSRAATPAEVVEFARQQALRPRTRGLRSAMPPIPSVPSPDYLRLHGPQPRPRTPPAAPP